MRKEHWILQRTLCYHNYIYDRSVLIKSPDSRHQTSHVILHSWNFMTGIHYMKDFGLSGMLMPIVTIFSQWFWLGALSGCMFWFKEIVQAKMKIVSFFSHLHVVPNHYAFILLVKHKKPPSNLPAALFHSRFITLLNSKNAVHLKLGQVTDWLTNTLKDTTLVCLSHYAFAWLQKTWNTANHLA